MSTIEMNNKRYEAISLAYYRKMEKDFKDHLSGTRLLTKERYVEAVEFAAMELVHYITTGLYTIKELRSIYNIARGSIVYLTYKPDNWNYLDCDYDKLLKADYFDFTTIHMLHQLDLTNIILCQNGLETI